MNLTLAPAQPYLNPLNLTVAPEPSQHREVDSQMVTIQQLHHLVPKKAQKEKESAEAALERKQQDEAIGHLESAIRIDPEFVRARNDLAVLYIWLGNPNSAIEQLNEAITIDPHSPLLFTNLAIGYIAAEHFVDAERAARVAGELNRAGRLPLYILATTLYYQNKFTDEALLCAQRTSDDYPLAHLFAARIFMERTQFERARAEIETYLSGANRTPVYVTTANSWLDFIAAHEPRVVTVTP
jgi:tetratricopeptide (TPR) repeat protein